MSETKETASDIVRKWIREDEVIERSLITASNSSEAEDRQAHATLAIALMMYDRRGR
ncbi:MAG: hypothetical protein RI885_2304 [Actinomycetota bacterium]